MGRGNGFKAVVAAALVLSAPAFARRVANVSLPETQVVQGTQVSLVNMALKEKFFLDLYVWGLYMEDEVTSEDEALASEGHKRLEFKMKRSLSRDQLVEGIQDVLGSAPGMQSPEMKRCLAQFTQALSEVKAGESLVISYVAGEGTYVTGKVTQEAFIPGKPFADALFEAWLEANPLAD